jgi:hypothetical protein
MVWQGRQKHGPENKKKFDTLVQKTWIQFYYS